MRPVDGIPWLGSVLSHGLGQEWHLAHLLVSPDVLFQEQVEEET